MFNEKLNEKKNNKKENMISIDNVNIILDKALPREEDFSEKLAILDLKLNRTILRNIVIAYFEDIKLEQFENLRKLDLYKEIYRIMINKSEINKDSKKELLKKLDSIKDDLEQSKLVDILGLDDVDSDINKEVERISIKYIDENENKSKINTYMSLMNE